MRTVHSAVDYSAYERVLADAIVEVATELRLADPIEFVLMIRGEQAANIADLVNSSSELFFKSGSLKYALAAGCELRWDSTPTVRLDMEFRTPPSRCSFGSRSGARAPPSRFTTSCSRMRTCPTCAIATRGFPPRSHRPA